MTAVEDVGWLSDAEAEWEAMQRTNGAAPRIETELRELRFVPLGDFVDVDEPGADPLVGEPGDVLIPQGGDVMIFGDGGAGKTTLGVDLAFHLAAGTDWCSIHIPTAVRVGVVENEGPRALFRQKLRRKRDASTSLAIGDRIHVLEHPWAELTFTDERHRAWIAAAIAQLQLDIVFAGPLTRIGMNEAGTLQQTRDFARLLADTRARAGRPVTFALFHHENKAGDVSGAWEGAGDTLLHITGLGNGRTRLHIAKARWASSWHGKSLNLIWAAGESFTVDDTERDDAAVADRILALVRERGGCSWNKVESDVGTNNERARAIRDTLLAAGQLVDANADKPSRIMQLWHTDDPLRPEPASRLTDAPGRTDAPASDTGGEA